jgi:tetratricopeptide (TPR) repeat protein
VIRQAVSILVLLTVATMAAGNDRLWLKDGGDLRGTVRIDGGDVVLTAKGKQSRHPFHTVQRIASRRPAASLVTPPAPASDSKADQRRHAHQWFTAGRKLDQLQLSRQAREAYREALKLNPHHTAANRAAGNVRVAGHWMAFYTALGKARGLLHRDQARKVLRDYVPALEKQAENTAALDVGELRAEALLRLLQFGRARSVYREIAEKATGRRRVRYTAMADLLEQSPDGVIVLEMPWPPQSALLDRGQPVLQAGPTSLAHPEAVEAAMHQAARARIARAEQHLDAVAALLRESDGDDIEGVQERLDQAEELFAQADALHAGISRPYRSDHCRMTMRLHRVRAETHARTFDRRMAILSSIDADHHRYVAGINELLRDIETVRDELHAVMKLAHRDRRTFAREIALARKDLATLQELRSELLGERRRVQLRAREVANAS